MSPVVGRVRAYFAPVNRAANAGVGQPATFDPTQTGSFTVDQPPAPWVDLGWVHGFVRKGGSRVVPLRTGAPAVALTQVRTEIEATVEFAFETWGKLQLGVACGSQSLNVLAVQTGAAGANSGGVAAAAVPLLTGSTASVLQVGAAAAPFAAGQVVAVDLDYAGQTGFVGSGISGAYVRAAVSDVDYLRRVTLNVGRVLSVAGGAVTLEMALPAGVPDGAMKVSRVLGFSDREGGSFFAEWSGLFMAEGQQGERLVWFYPRLQVSRGAMEEAVALGAGFEDVRLGAAFRALPVVDELDGERVVCFRSYLLAS